MRVLSLALTSLIVACGTPSQMDGPTGNENAGTGGGAGHGAGGSGASAGGTDAGGKAGGSAGAGGSSATGGGTAIGGSTASGGGSGTGGSSADGGSGVISRCDSPAAPGLPAGAPKLEVGTWKDISPAGFPWDPNTSTLGVAVDPCNSEILYVCTGSYDTSIGGLYKSTDAGSSWNRIGNVVPDWTGSDHLQAPLHVRIDPKDPQHLYVVQGVRGRQGFFESHDGGQNLTMPDGFAQVQATLSLYPYDVYSIAVDPTDFKHVLLSFHGAWGWTDTKWNTSSGVLESTDGGGTWSAHGPMQGWGTGHAISFLYQPERGLGDARTWLLGTQGAGMWRTTDGGNAWTKVSDNGIQHGGGTVYYGPGSVLVASGGDHNMRSTDNGATWTTVGDGGGYNAVGGDGKSIYTAKCFGPTPFVVSSDGVTWRNYSAQSFGMGTFDMAFDATNGILYSSNWGSGLWALKPE